MPSRSGVSLWVLYAGALSLGIALGFGSGALLPVLVAPAISQAQSSDTGDLQNQIDSTNSQIQELQNEIKQLQSQLTTTTKQKQTVQNAINALNLNIQKLQKSLALTQAQISQKDSQIQVLSTTIATTTTAVSRENQSAAESIRELNVLDDEPLFMTLLTGGTLSQFFDQAVQIADLQIALQSHIQTLSGLKQNLMGAKNATETARQALADYQHNLSSQQQSLVVAKVAQTQLLTTTKNNEATYQKQIAQKQAEESQFENELNAYQAKLKGVSSGSVPTSGVLLAWPLAHTSITQYFGNTPFATANPQIYNGHGHSGVDMAASPGTPVMAAADGIVAATGNTDLTVPGGSFGKYVFIRHDNGLATLYAHLGSIGVSSGERVTQGEVIGYSDTTGYATGPHLHFGVYVSSATVVEQLPTAQRQLVIPVAPLSAYLNPLSYLPPQVP